MQTKGARASREMREVPIVGGIIMTAPIVVRTQVNVIQPSAVLSAFKALLICSSTVPLLVGSGS